MSFMSLFGGRSARYTTLADEDDEIIAAAEPGSGFFSRLNPFGGRAVQLPADGDTEAQIISGVDTGAPESANLPEDEITWDGMLNFSKWDRILIFVISMSGAISCWVVSFILIPVLAFKPRKFAVLWSLGSILFLFSFGILQGFYVYLTHLFSTTRLWFTVSFTGSIIATLIFSLIMQNGILTIVASAIQLVSCIAYTISYFPLGRHGIRLAQNVAAVQVDSWLNS